jgi:hypothetical protein
VPILPVATARIAGADGALLAVLNRGDTERSRLDPAGLLRGLSERLDRLIFMGGDSPDRANDSASLSEDALIDFS